MRTDRVFFCTALYRVGFISHNPEAAETKGPSLKKPLSRPIPLEKAFAVMAWETKPMFYRKNMGRKTAEGP